MATNRPADSANSQNSGGKTRVVGVSPQEVLLVDCHAANPVLGRAEQVHVKATEAELFRAEHTAPDGSSATPHERHFTPYLIAGLGIVGLLVVAIGMFAAGGFRAMAVGVAWLIAGYAVAWIVVWAASIARARDEAVIEEEIIIRDLDNVRPQDSIHVR